MRFTVPVQAVLTPIMQVSSICSSSGVNTEDLSPYMLVEVKPNSLTLVGTDNNVQLKAQVPLPDGACESEGSFLISSSKARDFFKNLGESDDVSLALDDKQENLNIVSANGNYTIRVRKLDNDLKFPVFETEAELQDASTTSTICIEEHKLRYMIDKSVFCVSHENFRDYLRGVRFEANVDDFTIFALDGHRMAVLETKLPEPCARPISVSLTLRGANELNKLLSTAPDRRLELKFTPSFAIAQVGIYTLTSRLLKCNYPNVRAVLPKQLQSEASVDLELLKTYVKRVSGFSNKRLNNINFSFTQGKLSIFAQNLELEIGSAELASDFQEPEPREVNLNADFMKEFLGAMDTPKIVFGFSPPYANTLLRPEPESNDLGIQVRYIVSHIVV